jgi:signal transduction histidine kinase/CheY-like chemotaxis protein
VKDLKVRLARAFLGMSAKDGVIVVGSARENFPTEIERFLVQSAANQAAVALQNARLLEALEEVNADLESRVLERTKDLERTIAERERLQDQLLQAQKMESMGTLASGVAHDFNNLLNIILSHASIIRLSGSNPAAVSEGIAVIEEAIRRGANLVRQLMTLGRKTETRFEPVRLNGLCEKLAILLAETFPKTIVITTDLAIGLPPINADENQLHQALLNLCVNARDAMPGGGRLAFKTETIQRSDLPSAHAEPAADRYAAVSISDTGCGMDEVTLRRIFDPFFTTKPVGQGTGLGLALVYSIVQHHGGFIGVDSAIDRGTTFRIYLPITEATSQTGSENRAGSASRGWPGAGELILFVDDEERQLKLMQRFLEAEGYRVLPARDGAEAVEIFRRHKAEIAMAILDLGLPKLGGWEALQQMREVWPPVKALIASGFVSADVESEIESGKLAGVIRKPYKLEEVLEKVWQTIHQRPA